MQATSPTLKLSSPSLDSDISCKIAPKHGCPLTCVGFNPSCQATLLCECFPHSAWAPTTSTKLSLCGWAFTCSVSNTLCQASYSHPMMMLSSTYLGSETTYRAISVWRSLHLVLSLKTPAWSHAWTRTLLQSTSNLLFKIIPLRRHRPCPT